MEVAHFGGHACDIETGQLDKLSYFGRAEAREERNFYRLGSICVRRFLS